MPEIVKLKELLQTGRFEKINLGQLQNEVLAILGTPDYVKNKGGISLCSYGDLELYFDAISKSLTSMNLNFLSFWQRQYPSGGKNVAIDSWVIKAGLLLDDFIANLQQENIDYCEVAPINIETRQILVNQTITMIFNDVGDQIGLCELWAGN